MWTEIEQAKYFKNNIKDTRECPFLGVDNDDVDCKNCIFEKSLCVHSDKDDDFNMCFELSNKIILEERQKKLERLCITKTY